MIYAMSDLHGCYDLYIKMLEKINFSDDDTLYILGDVVDRGPDGIKIIQDIETRENAYALRGNHEVYAHNIFKKIYHQDENDSLMYELIIWKTIGGNTTYNSFINLSRQEQLKIIEFITNSLVYYEIEINGNKFHLSHTVPDKETMLAHKYMPYCNYLVGTPEYDKKYFEDKYIVTGHTPTLFINSKYEGKIYKNNNHIAIDCGAVFDGNLGCICLNNFKEFYVKNDYYD